MPRLASGSGFLVLDAVESGKVESGRQRRAATALPIWPRTTATATAGSTRPTRCSAGWAYGRQDAKGGGDVASLDERGVGAGSSAAAPPFTPLRRAEPIWAPCAGSGIWVGEDGTVGTVQQVDVNV